MSEPAARVIPLPRAVGPVPLGVAVDRFLDRFRNDPGTRTTYAETLARLTAAVGEAFPTGQLSCEVYEAVMARWDQRAANTWNKHLSALNSFAAYARRQDWLTQDPGRRLERRKVTRDRDKAIPRARLEKLFTDNRFALRERVFWRLAYETCARADELLELDVPDLDVEFRRGRVGEKGGDTAYVHWETPTARLLPRLLAGRTTGPVFLADRRAPASGKRAPALADIDPVTGRGRLSYPRAEYLFKQASKLHDPHGQGYTLHQLRHSGLKHLAEKGRSAFELQAKSRHKHLGTLGHYVQLGEETSARITAENDELSRRRRR